MTQYERFLCEYRVVREKQGWGQPNAAYFRALPTVARGDVHWEIWRRRRESLDLLLGKVIAPIAARRERRLRIADLGAGNCWLAYRLSNMGHEAAAVELSDDETDGLGARKWYVLAGEEPDATPFTSFQADFDHLPFQNHAFDVVVFNASFHYSTQCSTTLQEALRVVSPEGALVIMDSPVYHTASSGEQMVLEREQAFERNFGFRSDSLPAEHFLTVSRLEALGREASLHWQIHSLAGGKSHALRQWRRLRGLRELSEMPLIAGTRA
jgi:SAM-dependent methyltransferase